MSTRIIPGTSAVPSLPDAFDPALRPSTGLPDARPEGRSGRRALPAPIPAGLDRFLRQANFEMAVANAVRPVSALAALQDPAVFDAVLRRSREALRSVPVAMDDGAFSRALEVLDRAAGLRTDAHAGRNALQQG